MLKIKSNKWQEFCERAESMGFTQGLPNSYFLNKPLKNGYPNGWTLAIFKQGDLYVVEPNYDFREIWDLDKTVDENFDGSELNKYNATILENMIFDLIIQGFVEKVE